MDKRALLANVLFKYPKIFSFPIFNQIRASFLHVLAYHRIFPNPSTEYMFEESTISATPHNFEKQLAFLKQNFHVVNFKVLSDMVYGKERFPENLLIITFDDGYADNYEIAFQYLKSNELTAVFFCSTYFVDTGKPFWFDKLTYIIKKMPEIDLLFFSHRFGLEIKGNNKNEIRASIMDLFRKIPANECFDILNCLEQESGISISKKDLVWAKPLNWDQIKEMSDEGMEIGSHTINHPFLSNLSYENMFHELSESKRIIEQKTGKEVKSLAYPFGNYNKTVIKCAKHCGYDFGISFEPDIMRFSKDKAFSIPRVHVELDVNQALFQANLLLPHLFLKEKSFKTIFEIFCRRH